MAKRIVIGLEDIISANRRLIRRKKGLIVNRRDAHMGSFIAKPSHLNVILEEMPFDKSEIKKNLKRATEK